MTEHPLEQWLKARKPLRKRDFARQVGCSPSRITQIAKHNQAPSLALAAKLSEATGIPLDQFVVQTEAAQ